MALWSTINESDIFESEADYDQRVTEEATLHQLRGSYHRTLPLLYSPPSAPNLALARANLEKIQLSATQSAEETNSQTHRSECMTIAYLASKNLSKLLAEGGGSVEEALQASIETLSIMINSDQVDPGVLFRTSMLAQKHGDTWSCDLILKLNMKKLGPLFQESAKQLGIYCFKIQTDETGSSSDTTGPRVGLHDASKSFVRASKSHMPHLFKHNLRECTSLNKFITTLVKEINARSIEGDILVENGVLKVYSNEFAAFLHAELTGQGRASSPILQNEEMCSKTKFKSKKPKEKADAISVELDRRMSQEQSTHGVEHLSRNELEVSHSWASSGQKSGPDSNKRRSKRETTATWRKLENSAVPTMPKLVDNFLEEVQYWADAVRQMFGEQNDDVKEDVCSRYFSTDLIAAKARLLAKGDGEEAELVGVNTEAITNNGKVQINKSEKNKQEKLDMDKGLQEAKHAIDVRCRSILNNVAKGPRPPHLLLGLFSTLASVCAYGSEDPFALSSTLDNIDLASVILKIWKNFVSANNASLENCVEQLDDEEKVYLCECCCDIAKLRERATSRGSESHILQGLAYMSLSIIISSWLDCSSLIFDCNDASTTHELVLRTRQAWVLCLSQLSNLSECSPETFAFRQALLHFLTSSIKKLQGASLELRHLSKFSRVDLINIRLVSTMMSGQDDFVRKLSASYVCNAHWVNSALDLLRDDDKLTSVLIISTRSGSDDSGKFLPEMVLQTLASLGRIKDWFVFMNRIMSSFLSVVLPLAGGGEWFSKIVDALYRSLGADHVAQAATIELELDPSTKKAVKLLANCTITVVLGSNCTSDLLDTILSQIVQWVPIWKAGGAQEPLLEVCVGLIHSLIKISGTNEAAKCRCLSLSMYILRAIRHVRAPCAKEHRHAFALIMLKLYRTYGRSAHAIRYTASTALCSVLVANEEVPVKAKVDFVLKYHEVACDHNFYTVDGGELMLEQARCLHRSFCGTGDEPDHDDNPLFSHIFSFDSSTLTADDAQDLCVCLGEMYWLLYKFPLVAFSYDDDQQQSVLLMHDSTGDAITKRLFNYYKLCGSMQIGDRSDRKASLLSMLSSHILRSAPQDSGNYVSLSKFLFKTMRSPEKTDVLDFLQEMERRAKQVISSVSSDLHPMLASTYYEVIAHFVESGSSTRDTKDLNEVGYLSNALSLQEKRIVFLIHMCCNDLALNPDRYESWAMLHRHLVELIHIVLDRITEACVPDALPFQLHTDLFPRDFGVDSLFYGLADSECEVLFEEDHSVTCYTQVDIMALASTAFVDHTDPSVVESLYPMLAVKNALVRGANMALLVLRSGHASFRPQSILEISNQILDRRKGKEESAKDLMVAKMQPLLTHAKLLRLLALGFSKGSTWYRECVRSSLDCFEGARDELNTEGTEATGCGIYVCVMCASLQWEVYHNTDATVTRLREAKTMMETSAILRKQSLLNHVVHGIAEIAADMACVFLSRDVNPSDLILNRALIKLTQSMADSSTANFVEDDICHARQGFWHVLLNCTELLQACKMRDPHYFKATHTLAVILEKLSNLNTIPAWFTARLKDVKSVSAKGALQVLKSLFGRKLPQLIAIWYPEKALNEWDTQMQRTIVFESYRRTITEKYLHLIQLCGEAGLCAEFLRNAYRSKRQTASIGCLVFTASLSLDRMMGSGNSRALALVRKRKRVELAVDGCASE